MGRVRKGILTQSHKKLKSNRRLNTKREKNIGFRNNKQIDENKTSIPEEALEFMKTMNPQQLVDFLFPNDGSFCRYRSTDYVSLRKTKEIKDRKQNNSK